MTSKVHAHDRARTAAGPMRPTARVVLDPDAFARAGHGGAGKVPHPDAQLLPRRSGSHSG